MLCNFDLVQKTLFKAWPIFVIRELLNLKIHLLKLLIHFQVFAIHAQGGRATGIYELLYSTEKELIWHKLCGSKSSCLPV